MSEDAENREKTDQCGTFEDGELEGGTPDSIAGRVYEEQDFLMNRSGGSLTMK